MRLRRRLPLLKRGAGGLLALWLIALQFPIAWPISDLGKDRSIPFLCMNRPCGCRSAAECWTSCCCTTKQERIAFARSLGLPIPDEPQVAETAVPHKRDCCTHGNGEAACETTAGDVQSSEGVVLLSSVLRCRGLSMMLLHFAGFVPSPAPVICDGHEPPAGQLFLVDDALPVVALSPPTPPPRLVSTGVTPA
jgi:hypothetical protein